MLGTGFQEDLVCYDASYTVHRSTFRCKNSCVTLWIVTVGQIVPMMNCYNDMLQQRYFLTSSMKKNFVIAVL